MYYVSSVYVPELTAALTEMYTAALRVRLPRTPGSLGKLFRGIWLFSFKKKKCSVFLRKGTIWKHLNPKEPLSKFMDGCSLMTFSQWLKAWTCHRESLMKQKTTKVRRFVVIFALKKYKALMAKQHDVCWTERVVALEIEKGRRKWLLLSWLEWLPKSHTWEGISHVCNTRMRCFPEQTCNREVSITLPSTVSTWVFQQNAKFAFPVQLVTPLDLVGRNCNGNTPALWLENSFSKFFKWIRNSHGFCLVLQGLLLQCLPRQSITSELALMNDVLGEKLTWKLWIALGHFSSRQPMDTTASQNPLYSFFCRYFPKDYFESINSHSKMPVFEGPFASLLHYIISQDKKANEFVTTAYDYPHSIPVSKHHTGTTSLQ